MLFLLWLLGILVGIVLSIIYCIINNICIIPGGIIEVDVQSNLCKIHVTSEKLSNFKTKKVIFKVVHDVDLSREEQIL